MTTTTTAAAAEDLALAQLAVARAVLLTRTLHAPTSLPKPDQTPVTIADYGAQALLIGALHAARPDDRFVGEESAAALRAGPALAAAVWRLVREVQDGFAAVTPSLHRFGSEAEMLDAIDRGCAAAAAEGGAGGMRGRVWVLDPIDGTAAFVRGGQYAVCLALLEDGVQQLGVLGCPNLEADAFVSMTGRRCKMLERVGKGCGILVSAVRGGGAWLRPFVSADGQLGDAVKVPPRQPLSADEDVVFVESTASSTANHKLHREVAESIAKTRSGTGDVEVVWPGMESFSMQMRYVALALGVGDVLLRLPKRRDYAEAAWDHAGGILIFEETGGVVTDAWGKELQFGAGEAANGRYLTGNWGMLAAPAAGGLHGELLTVVAGIMKGFIAKESSSGSGWGW